MKLEFDPHALADLLYWVKNDKKKAEKVLSLIQEILKTPFKGTGKPEPLKYVLDGAWSRRIDREHRLVYCVEKDVVIIKACRFHY